MAKKQERPDIPKPQLQNTSNVDTDVFVKGMTKDGDIALTGKENWTHCRNCINNSAKGDAGTIGNEPGNLICSHPPYTIIGGIHLYGDKWVVFTTDDENSEIGLFDDSKCEYETLVNAPCLNFDKRYLITGASKENFECQWVVYWDDGLNPSRYLNIDDIPWFQNSTQNDNCTIYTDIVGQLNCERLRLAPIFEIPCIKLSKAKDGGRLQNGSYEAYIAYMIDDNKVTDYFKSNIQTLWDHQENSGSLDIHITGLDKQFETYELIIFTNAGMQKKATRVGVYSTEQEYINIDFINESQTNEVPAKNLPLYTPVFERSDKMYSVNDYLLRQGPITDFDFNYQCQANDITTQWVSTQYPSDYYVKGGNKPTFMRDEQYAFFIRFVYNTGNKSSSYHIPGRQADAVDLGPPVDLSQVIASDGAPANWQVTNTAAMNINLIDNGAIENLGQVTDDGGIIVAKGQMGYWESTERYPAADPVRWCELCGDQIRHHKFPEEDTHWSTRRNTNDSQFIYILGVEFSDITFPTFNDGITPIPNIAGYEILVGDRKGNKSIIAKGLARNMRRYTIATDATQSGGRVDVESASGQVQGLLPNYPFNDLGRDPYLSQREVIRQDEYMPYGSAFTSQEFYTFHSPETSFDRPFLNPTEIKSYGIGSGFSLGRFKKSEEHPKHKLIRDIAALVAAVIGAGYAIMEMRGEKISKVKGSTSLSIGQDVGPFNKDERYQENSTVNTTAGTGTGGVSVFGVVATGGTGTGGVANVNIQGDNDTDGDGWNEQDVINVTSADGTIQGEATSGVPNQGVSGGGAAPGMAGTVNVGNVPATTAFVAGPFGGGLLNPPNPAATTVTPAGATNISQAGLNAANNQLQMQTAQTDGTIASGGLPGQESAEGSGGMSTSGSGITGVFTNAWEGGQEQDMIMSTTPLGDVNSLFSGGLPNSVSGAEEDYLHDIKTKNENAAMQTPGHMGPSRDVETRGSRNKALPGFLQIMFKAYTFLNFMTTGGQNIIELIYELMSPQDYAYKYNAYGLYSINNSTTTGQRYRMQSQRCRYVSSAFQNIGPSDKINNLHRPKTVVLQGDTQFLVRPDAVASVPADDSKFVLGELPPYMLNNPTNPLIAHISAHYVGLKFRVDNQYGQLQGIRQLPIDCVTYFRDAICTNCIDTVEFGEEDPNNITIFESNSRFRTSVLFGGDAYINRYSEKVIMPFFWDFLQGEPDGYNFDYRLHQNVPFVRFWYNSDKYNLAGLVRPITDLSFQWLSNPDDAGLPSALHNLDRIGTGVQTFNITGDNTLGNTGNAALLDDYAISQTEQTSGAYGQVPGTGWGSGGGGLMTTGGFTDTSGDSQQQSLNSNWNTSIGPGVSSTATKPNGLFTIRNAFCYLHSNGVNEFFVESELNMAQRDWDDKPEGRHYDNQEFTDLDALFHADIIKDGNFYKYDQALKIRNLPSTLLSYGFLQELSYDPLIAESCHTHYPKRIMYSLQAQDEAKRDFWRIFLPNNKEDFKEVVTTIKPINKTGAVILFPHRAPQMWQGVDTLQTQGDMKVTIGDGGLFQGSRQNVVNADLPHEYASCESSRSVINTPSGLYFISQAQGKIFNYTGSLSNLADAGMKQWFNTYLPSRLLKTFPELEGTVDADNPVSGIGTQSVYDPNFDLVYFMKKDYELCCLDCCVEYNPEFGFVINNTECSGAEQIASCEEGFTLYEAGEIHPGTGEILLEPTCCNLNTNTWYETTEVIIYPIEDDSDSTGGDIIITPDIPNISNPNMSGLNAMTNSPYQWKQSPVRPNGSCQPGSTPTPDVLPVGGNITGIKARNGNEFYGGIASMGYGPTGTETPACETQEGLESNCQWEQNSDGTYSCIRTFAYRESLTQKLNVPFQAGVTYQTTLTAAAMHRYKSMGTMHYSCMPIRIEIWGGNSPYGCQGGELTGQNGNFAGEYTNCQQIGVSANYYYNDKFGNPDPNSQLLWASPDLTDRGNGPATHCICNTALGGGTNVGKNAVSVTSDDPDCWGCNDDCRDSYAPIQGDDYSGRGWEEYTVTFTPTQDWDYIVIKPNSWGGDFKPKWTWDNVFSFGEFTPGAEYPNNPFTVSGPGNLGAANNFEAATGYGTYEEPNWQGDNCGFGTLPTNNTPPCPGGGIYQGGSGYPVFPREWGPTENDFGMGYAIVDSFGEMITIVPPVIPAELGCRCPEDLENPWMLVDSIDWSNGIITEITPEDCVGILATERIETREVVVAPCGDGCDDPDDTAGASTENRLYIYNPDFEGTPANGIVPPFWDECFQGSYCEGNLFQEDYAGTPCVNVTQTPDTLPWPEWWGAPSIYSMLPNTGTTYVGFLHACGGLYNDFGDNPDVQGKCPCNCGGCWPQAGQFSCGNQCAWKEGAIQKILDCNGNPTSMTAGQEYNGTVVVAAPRQPNSSCKIGDNRRVELQIWGGNSMCGNFIQGGQYVDEANPDSELLWSSGDITENETLYDQWIEYAWTINASQDWEWILFTGKALDPAPAYPGWPGGFPYGGGTGTDKAENRYGSYIFVDSIAGDILPPVEEQLCCQCPDGYETVLNDGIYETPVSPADCIKEHNDNRYFDLTDDFDVICVSVERTPGELGDAICIRSMEEVEGGCVPPTLEDDITEIDLTDEEYFKDVSWTVSYDPKISGWVSFHDWHPDLTFASLDHFLTTKDLLLDEILCPPGYELDPIEGVCCRETFITQPAVMTLEYGEYFEIDRVVDTTIDTDNTRPGNSFVQNPELTGICSTCPGSPWGGSAPNDWAMGPYMQYGVNGNYGITATPDIHPSGIYSGVEPDTGTNFVGMIGALLYSPLGTGMSADLTSWGFANPTGNYFTSFFDGTVNGGENADYSIGGSNRFAYKEGITQRLNSPLLANETYVTTIVAAAAHKIFTGSSSTASASTTSLPTCYPVQFEIWGSMSPYGCEGGTITDNGGSSWESINQDCGTVGPFANLFYEDINGNPPTTAQLLWASPDLTDRGDGPGTHCLCNNQSVGMTLNDMGANQVYPDPCSSSPPTTISATDPNGWQEYQVIFTPTQAWEYITIRANAWGGTFTPQWTWDNVFIPAHGIIDIGTYENPNYENLVVTVESNNFADGLMGYAMVDSFGRNGLNIVVENTERDCNCEAGFTMIDSSGNPTEDCGPNNRCVKVVCNCEEFMGETRPESIEGDCDTYEQYIGLEVNPHPQICTYKIDECINGSNLVGGIWRHNVRCDLFTNYYGVQHPWEIEFVESVGQTVNTLRSIEYEMESYLYRQIVDYTGEEECGFSTNLHEHVDCTTRWHDLDHNFNRAYIYNTEQVSGNLHLNISPKNNAPEINTYPQININVVNNENSFIDILYDKEEQKYRFNQFWDITKNRGEIIQPIGNFDSNAIIDQQSIIFTELNGYVRKLNSLNLDYDKPPHQRKKFRHYWNKIVLGREPEIDEEGNVIPETRKMLFKLDNAKINVSFR